jgi:hypothetical protein
VRERKRGRGRKAEKEPKNTAGRGRIWEEEPKKIDEGGKVRRAARQIRKYKEKGAREGKRANYVEEREELDEGRQQRKFRTFPSQ